MKTRLSAGFAVVLVILAVVGCTSLDQDTVAVIQGDKVPMSEFTEANPPQRFAGKDEAFVRDRVDAFVQRKVFALEARAMDLQDDEGVKDKLTKASQRQMMQYVYERAILDDVLNDSVLADYYEQSRDEIHARHILIQWEGIPRAEAKRTKDQALVLAGNISERLKKGEDFESLANQFTEDPSGKNNGGDLGWFSWGKMVPPFQEVAFALSPGEVSDIVETQFGFHIIKLEGRRDRGLGPLSEVRDQLQREMRRSMNDELRNAANTFLDNLKAAARFEFIDSNMNEFLQVWRGSQFKTLKMDEVFSKLSYTAPLFKLNGEELGGNWIIQQLAEVPAAQRPKFENESQFKAILDQLVTQDLITAYGNDQDYAGEDEFQQKMKEFEDKYIYDLYMKNEVNDQLSPTDQDLQDYYDRNKETKYMDQEKVQIREIFVRDELLAQDIRKRIDAGENFDVLAGRYTERKSAKDNRGELPPFQRGRYGAMGNKAFEMEIGELAGPIELGNGYSIIKLEQKIEAGPKPFEKVKGRLRTDITNELRTARIAEIMKDLTRKYHVKINYDAAFEVFLNSGDQPS